MRQAEKEKKKIQSLIPFILALGKRIPKKIVKKFKKYKTSSRQYFQPKRDDISQKGENKILVPNSVQSRRGQENFKKNSKKIKKLHPSIIFCQNGMRQVEKVKRKFQSRIPFILDPGMKISKKIVKKLNNLFPALFFAKTG